MLVPILKRYNNVLHLTHTATLVLCKSLRATFTQNALRSAVR